MHTLQVIIGSTRPTRAADQVARWVMDRARRHPDLRPELLDLREWPLPMFGEHFGTIGDFADLTYSDPMVRSWNAKIREGDSACARLRPPPPRHFEAPQAATSVAVSGESSRPGPG
jgi:NAD(P)H-dependent FMN reductase